MKSSILRLLTAQTYLDETSSLGRANISAETRSKACILFDHADRMLGSSTNLPDLQRRTYHLIVDFLFAEKYLSENEQPRYIHYTNMPLLDRFLRDTEPVTLRQVTEQARRALAIVMNAWHDQETRQLSSFTSGSLSSSVLGFSASIDGSASIEHLVERERGLRRLIELDSASVSTDTRIVTSELAKYPTVWHYFAAFPDLQIAKLLLTPRSLWHDEFMFLAVIHATECCYAGILAPLRSLPTAILKQDWVACTELVKSCLFFSDFLVKLWSIFDTMPVAHFFSGFLTATGDASAIQSTRFQELEVLTRGIGPHKATVIARFPELSLHARWAPPEEATIKGILALGKAGSGSEEFVSAATLLERDLYKWRARHYGIALKYLPKTDVGTGQEGVPYLAKTFNNPGIATGEKLGADEKSLLQVSPIRGSTIYRLDGQAAPSVLVFGFTLSDWSEEATEKGYEVAAAMADQFLTAKGRTAKLLERYREDFSPHPVPAERLIDAYRSGSLSSVGPLELLELCVAISTGGLIGCFVDQRTSGELVVDFSRGGEAFVDRTGKDRTCIKGEIVLRDSKGLLFSFRQGADRRALPLLNYWKKGTQVTAALVLPRKRLEISSETISRVGVIIESLDCDNFSSWTINEY